MLLLIGWWGFTFPLGVYSLSTIHFGTEMPSLFFRVLGTIGAVAVVLLWSRWFPELRRARTFDPPTTLEFAPAKSQQEKPA